MFSPVDLFHFFQKSKGVFTNRNRICFEMVTDEYFVVSTAIPSDLNKESVFPMRLEIKHFGLYELFNTYHIYSPHVLKQKINFATLYDLYYAQGKGQVIITLTEYLHCSPLTPVEIYFEYSPEDIDKTKIYIPFLNYFEELEEGFYDIEQYAEYIQKHHHLFEWLLKNKSNIQFCKNLGQDECRN